MARQCWFCHSQSDLHQVNGMTMCGGCAIDWMESPEQRDEMLRGQNAERMERNLQDPGYIYDLMYLGPALGSVYLLRKKAIFDGFWRERFPLLAYLSQVSEHVQHKEMQK